MRVLKILSTTINLIAVVAFTTLAATPTAIHYQGRLTNAGGTAVPDASYSVVFTIYDATSGGTSKWTETQSVTTSGGLFAVLLGTISPVSDTVFNGATRYLGVKVGADPEMLPRVALVSVPFSMRTATVDGATGGNISGNLSLEKSTATTGNIYKGGDPFISDFGPANTFIGHYAGNQTLTGVGNTATGSQTLLENTTGDYNCAFGVGALELNSTGFWNTACGVQAMYGNTTGNNNTAIGLDALKLNSTGSYNVAAGMSALYSNITGDSNTANGVKALYSNTSGSGNTASGETALYSNTTGTQNTATGAGALYSNSTGGINSAFGSSALFRNTTGFWNTAGGVNALYSNTTGGYNTAVGVNALYANTTATKNTGIGVGALTSDSTGSNNTVSGVDGLSMNTIGNGNTASGVSALYSNISGNNNTAQGTHALYSNISGNNNTAQGQYALYANITGANNTAVGWEADVAFGNLTNATAIGYSTVVNASNKIRFGNAAVTVIEGQVAYTFTSDRNQKENFQPVDGDDVLRKISGFSMTSWNYKKQDRSQFRHYGPMAQEFFAAFGHDRIGQCGDSITMNSGDEAGILFAAVQALEKRNLLLEQQVADIAPIKAENKALRSEVDDLKRTVNQILAQSKQDGTSKYTLK